MASINHEGHRVETLSHRHTNNTSVESILKHLENDDPFSNSGTPSHLDHFKIPSHHNHFKMPHTSAATSNKRQTNHVLCRTFFIIIVTIAVSIASYMLLFVPAIDIIGRGNSYSLAKSQSYGFFRDISNHDWKLMKERVKDAAHHHPVYGPDQWTNQPHKWFYNNWDPTFSCYHERKVGALGVGGKWVCDPDRIKNKSGKCLVYSWGNKGTFFFEEGLRKIVGDNKCEIHVFEAFPEKMKASVPSYYHFHPWGLKSKESPIVSENFKTLEETLELLGHNKRAIDIFKIDCEQCEWTTYTEWLESDAEIMQILVELHTSPADRANAFFESLLEDGYVIFHKEANTQFGGGRCYEYGFLKLHRSFFSD